MTTEKFDRRRENFQTTRDLIKTMTEGEKREGLFDEVEPEDEEEVKRLFEEQNR